MIFMYIIQSFAKSLIVDFKFLQISFTCMRNRNGPNTLSCGTTNITLTYSDNCPPTLTLCEWPITHTTILETLPRLQFSKTVGRTELYWKLFKNQLLLCLSLLSHPGNQLCSGTLRLFGFLHVYPSLNPYWPSYNHLFLPQTRLIGILLRRVPFACRTLRLSCLVSTLWYGLICPLVNMNHCGSFPVTWNSNIIRCYV